jgi:hypothetical protein
MQKQAKKHCFRIEAKKISCLFRFISLQSDNDGSFRFFFVLFSLRSIFVSLEISMFRINAKQAKHRSEKNFASVSLHFAKMTPHPSQLLSTELSSTRSLMADG